MNNVILHVNIAHNTKPLQKIMCIKKKNNINSELYIFLQKLSKINSNLINIVFYGGEPLIYFNEIKEIIKNTKTLNVTYSIITNGSMLNREIVDYINHNNIEVSISWDGKRSIYTRNFDIFSEKERNVNCNNKLHIFPNQIA